MSTISEMIQRNADFYKPSEIVGHISKTEFSPNTRKIIQVMIRDGFKCDCCGESNVVFTLHKHRTKERFKFRPHVLKGNRRVRMTLDHNVLDCLDGGNSKDNMTALCEDCNALRQHKFAEYNEFKHWYHNADRSVEPLVNYCFIDFKKNAQDTHILKSLQPITVFPMNLFSTLKDGFIKGDIDAFKHFDKGAKHFDIQCISTALNELIQIYMNSYIGVYNARVPAYTFRIEFDCESIKEFGILFNEQISLAIAEEIKYYNQVI